MFHVKKQVRIISKSQNRARSILIWHDLIYMFQQRDFFFVLNWTRCWSQIADSASFMWFQNTFQFELSARFIDSDTLPRQHLTKWNVLWRLVNYFWNKFVSVLKAYLSTCRHFAPTGKVFICRRGMSVKGLKMTHFIVLGLQNLGLFSPILPTVVSNSLTWIWHVALFDKASFWRAAYDKRLNP